MQLNMQQIEKATEDARTALELFWAIVQEEPMDLTGKTAEMHLITLSRQSVIALQVFKTTFNTMRIAMSLESQHPQRDTWRAMYKSGPAMCQHVLNLYHEIYKVSRELAVENTTESQKKLMEMLNAN
jgi:hypothetical protein